MTRPSPILLGLLLFWVALGWYVFNRAAAQDAQLDRIEDVAGSCIVSVDACEPDLEPMAPGDNKVKRFLCRQDLKRLRFGSTTEFVGQVGCNEVKPRPMRVLDPVFTEQSLAVAQVCNVLTSQTCEERFPDGMPSCRMANTPLKFLCGCRGVGEFRTANGNHELDGFFRDFRILPNNCGGSNGCAVQLEMEANQWWALQMVRDDTNAQKYPADRIRAMAATLLADGERGKNRASLPACLRPTVPRRAGHADISPADEDTDAPDLFPDGGTPQ